MSITKRIFILLFVFCSSLLISNALDSVAPRTSDYSCVQANSSFLDGEILVYKAYYNWQFVWIPAGEVTFTITEDSSYYNIVAIGKTYKSYNAFFKVNDYFATKIDKKTMLPSTFVRRVEEGKYRQFDSLTFDRKNMLVHSHNGKTKEVAQAKTLEIDACALDMISVMYTLRNTNVNEYKEGDFLNVSMVLDKEILPIKINYKQKEVKKIRRLGKYPTIKVNPQLVVGNVFKKGDVMNIWVSDDKNKVPLLIESPISVGSIKAVLKSYNGLRHEGLLKSQ